MKRITKLILLIIIFGVIFSYKDEIADHWVRYRFHTTDDPFTVGIQGAQRARDDGDFEMSLLLLTNLEKNVVGSAQGENSERPRNIGRHKVLYCEQAILYKKIAMKHLQEGNILLYNQYILLTADTLKLCAGGIKDLQ